MPVKIVECPRDAMQGFHSFIKTDDKIAYINQLLKVGFYALDCGSFVSAKSVPQLADTANVLNNIDFPLNGTKLLVITANERGAAEACSFKNVSTLGFPFSISEQFQLRNTKQNFQQATNTLININELCQKADKELLVYLSMGFGNPYDEPWSVELAFDWCAKLANLGITQINLSDTIGKALNFLNCASNTCLRSNSELISTRDQIIISKIFKQLIMPVAESSIPLLKASVDAPSQPIN